MNTNEIHVGAESSDLRSNDGRHIQMAIDALARRGGGVVQLEAGTYVLSDALRMASNVTLRGVGTETLLTRIPVCSSSLRVDADKAQTEIRPVDCSGFRAGMGIALHYRGHSNRTMPRYITRIENDVLYLDELIDTDYIAEDGAVVANEFPMIHGERVDDVIIEDMRIDCGGANENGYGSPGIYVRTGRRWQIKRVLVENAVGDGLIFSQQSTHGRVEDSEFANATNFGVHPGSHSAHCTVTRCDIHHCGGDGLYICWGISHSSFTRNKIHHNGHDKFRHGISIGHKDTDNLIAGNHVYENWKHGICVREKTPANSAHRNIFRANIIENNGTLPERIPKRWQQLPEKERRGFAVSLNGSAEDLVFENNIIRETRAVAEQTQKHALYIGPHIRGLRWQGNTIEGISSELLIDEADDESNDIVELTTSLSGAGDT